MYFITFDVEGSYGNQLDADCDFIPNIYDVCPGFSDILDIDQDGLPDDCDVCSSLADPFDFNDNEVCDLNDPDIISNQAGYDFENLLVNNNINGQDNWVTISYSPITNNNGSLGINPNGLVSRKNDNNWSFPTIDECTKAITMEFNLSLPTASPSSSFSIGFGADLDNNGNLNSTSETTSNIIGSTDWRTFNSGVGGYLWLPSQTTGRFLLMIDFDIRNGAGVKSLYLRDGNNWMPIEKTNIDISQSTGSNNPLSWDGIYMQYFDFSPQVVQVDNIDVTVYSGNSLPADLVLSGSQTGMEDYNAVNTIMSDQMIDDNATLTYSAGQSISLQPGFELESPSSLDIFIASHQVCLD